MLCSALAMVVLSYSEHHRSFRPSSILCIFLLVSLVGEIVQTRTIRHKYGWSTLSIGYLMSILLRAFLLLLESRSKRKQLKEPFKGYSPESTSSVLNQTLFLWINVLFKKGFRHLLTLADLFGPDAELSSQNLQDRFQTVWQMHCEMLCTTQATNQQLMPF